MSFRPSRNFRLTLCAVLAVLSLSLIPSFVGYTASFNIPNGDVNAFIAAINQANAAAGKDEINLAAGGTYTFSAIDNEYMEIHNGNPVFYGANAMPQINSNIVINGNGATIQRDPLFSSCNASNELRMFWVNGSGKLTLKNVTVKNGCVGEYGSGGAIYARGGGTVSVFGSTFENNKTAGIVLDGGAITVDSGFLFVEQSIFMNNAATYLGGALSLDSSTGVIANSIFTGNHSDSSGGAVAGDWNSDVAIYGGSFTANNANSGGAVVSRNKAKMRLIGVNFVANTTVFDGGAASNSEGLMIVTNSTFANNTATSGGAIDNDNSSTGKLHIFNSSFSDNTAQSFGGGAIANGGAELFITDTTFTNNKAPDSDFGGAAIYTHNGATTLVNVAISGGTTAAEGGAIYSSGNTLNITKSTFTNNSATNGGAIETYTTNATIHSSTFSGNSANNGEFFFRGKGGAIYSGAKMTIVNSVLNNNTASGYVSLGDSYGGGGAIYAADDFTTQPLVTVINSTISGNSTGTLGGGIFVDETADVDLQNVTITGNSATTAGGGLARLIDDLFPQDAEVITIGRSIIIGNTSSDCDNKNYQSSGNNVFGSGCSNVAGDSTGSNVSAVLNTTLADNGGLTFTHALVNGSPAIDKGGNGCTPADQRGFARSGACDSGAFEFNGTAGAAPGLVITQTGGSTNVGEGGTGDSYSLTLTSAPTSIVTVSFYSDGEATVSPSTVIFTPQNWNVPQNVNVSAVVDFLTEPAHTGLIAHTLTSTDPNYNAAPAQALTVNISADTTGGETPTPETPTPTVTVTPEPEGELTDNGSFEGVGSSNAVPAGWTVKQASGDKRKCNKDGKIVALNGNCAFQFKGNAGENSQLTQKITSLNLQTGDTLQLSAWVNGKNAVSGGQLTAKVVYADDTKGKISVNVNTGTYEYTQISAEMFTLEKASSVIKLAVRNRGTSGKFIVDDLSLITSNTAGIVKNNQGDQTNGEGLLPLPIAEPTSSGRK